ncbi:YicC family protein [Bacteroidales bacterium OttesenSCG-928-K22]|nr:YicC family protein [Bacteroidales bacterium OttesenSCG-928-K22]
MTGFGKTHFFFNGKKVNVEIKSLNSKQLDFNSKLPSIYKEKEFEIRSLISQELLRGKIELLIYCEQEEGEKRHSINRNVAMKYFEEIKELENALKLKPAEEYVPIILKLPEVVEFPNEEVSEDELKELYKCVNECIFEVKSFRAQEGKSLEADFKTRINKILDFLTEISPYEQNRIETIKERIINQLNTLKDTMYDKNRFEQEMIYYLEKIDITEEKVRLKNHCVYFLETLAENESKGKQLSFITQEIGREINTIGSKANDMNIQQFVIKMKDELEKIREQLSNIL